ncbi:MAG: HAMP domain-containing histidine kinase, partial [Dysgonamonadaceae bacterium]|nr:HAMP domain-containing histidine kinase [Dysgonamonadaceae bacterium]
SKNDYQRPLIRVSDNGDGILPEVLDKIFIPFFTTKSTGSGIGLSICRQIINLHGGVISVHSEPEKGSCFTIQL